jgi:twitching motility two-component system response regulator PilH
LQNASGAKKQQGLGMGILNRLRTAFAKTPEKPETAPAVVENPQLRERRKNRRIDARKGTRVLIIDDSPTVLTFLKKVFTSAGYIPLIAANAERGLHIARTEQPDLVVLDVIMPGMNGFAALRHIRRDPDMKHLPVIMMSGNEQASEQFYVMRIGADGFMKKPFSRFDVFSRVERMLDTNLAPRRLQA